MSNIEEDMLARWVEINRIQPPGEHLQSTLKANTTTAIRVVYPSSVPANAERNKNILQQHKSGCTPGEIALTLGIRKSIVAGVINRYGENSGSILSSDVEEDQIRFFVNDGNLEFPFLLSYKGNKTAVQARHYLMLKALLNNAHEWYPTKDLLDIYYEGKELPKTAQNCLRKQIRLIRENIEHIGLTLIVKPRYGYKIVEILI
jgi:DNA-binding response OmpR family regulator